MNMHSSAAYRPRSQGIALVLVLGFLVILSALVLSFFTSVGNELVASQSAEAGVSTRQLADTATNVVMAQIGGATVGMENPSDPSSKPLAWASQPGMIRTYTEEGLPFRYHKLYSAKDMLVKDFSTDGRYDILKEFKDVDTPDNWPQNPATFVDLNAPVQDKTGVWRFPIMDPSAQQQNVSAKLGPGEIEGFEIAQPPGYRGMETNPNRIPSFNPGQNAESNPAPMPVRWIYVLRDGTLTAAPAGDTKGVISWDDVIDPLLKPRKDNPIVGRIAFWTDDDTSKININTASEGTFWDRPWSRRAPDETGYAANIPAQNEFQRYPGHPAMTCLSPVLGSLMPVTSYQQKSAYYFLVPRIMDGGTKGGTTQSTGPMTSDNERLFASVDELAYAPAFSGVRAGWSQALPSSKADQVTELLEKSKFFLTASSRAPDVNLFNKPRISLWPIQARPQWRNVKDKLIAFCTSVGAADTNSNKAIPFYFQRATEYGGNGRSSFNTGINYPSSQHPTMDLELPRNKELMAYLARLTESKVPGFGGDFRTKYDRWTQGVSNYNDRDQILTSMFDYIRTNVNSYSTASNLTPQYDYAPTRKGGVPVPGETQLIPTVDRTNFTRGFGRFSTVSEVAVVFHRENKANVDTLQAGLVLELFNPVPGLASWSPHVRYEIEGLSNFRVSGPALEGGDAMLTMGWPDSNPAAKIPPPVNWVTSRVGYSGGGHNLAFMGTSSSTRYYSGNNSDSNKVTGRGGAEAQYPFYTDSKIKVTNAAQRFNFSGGDITIKIYSGYENIPPGGSAPSRAPSPDLLVQTLRLRFDPANNLPIPTTRGPFGDRLGDWSKLIQTTDTTRSYEVSADGPAKGDLRMMHGLVEVDPSYFKPHYKYFTQDAHAHSIRSHESGNANKLYHGGTTERVAKIVSTGQYNKEPAVARGLAAALNGAGKLGDFDNATGDQADGAYVSKSDEGNIDTGDGGYFADGSFNVEQGRTFSPNRQISSAVSFGSLPTGMKVTQRAVQAGDGSAALGRPWQTLLFTPWPAARDMDPQDFGGEPDGRSRHFGFGTALSTEDNLNGKLNRPPYRTPPDHLFLDLFTMPVIEPYAISEPFSTAGRVNLNYQIAPFTYIKRTTALRGVLRSTKIMAIPHTSSDKTGGSRYEIDAGIGNGSAEGFQLETAKKGTLWGFQEKFEQGDIFRSASQICDIALVPVGQSYEAMAKFWNANLRTGDNVREIPYGHIYPRVTTKSNTFTVHVRVQALRKAKSPTNSQKDAEWDESRDQVVGEYRGSTTLERYIDASNPNLPDFAHPNVKEPLDKYYRFRVVNTRQFVR